VASKGLGVALLTNDIQNIEFFIVSQSDYYRDGVVRVGLLRVGQVESDGFTLKGLGSVIVGMDTAEERTASGAWCSHIERRPVVFANLSSDLVEIIDRETFRP